MNKKGYIMLSLFLNLLLLTQVQSKIVYIKIVSDINGNGRESLLPAFLEEDIAALISRNFVANYCKGDEFETIVSELYNTFMVESSDISQCIDEFRTRLVEFIRKTNNKRLDFQDMAKHMICENLVMFCIEQRDVLCNLDSASKDFKDYTAFMKFYISTLCKYGVYKAVIRPFLTMIDDCIELTYQRFANYAYDYGQFIDLRYIELLGEVLNSKDVICMPYDIHNLSQFENIGDFMQDKIDTVPCDDKTFLICSFDSLQIMPKIRSICNNTRLSDAEAQSSSNFIRFGSKIPKDEGEIAKKEQNLPSTSSCKPKYLYILPNYELDVIVYVFWRENSDIVRKLPFCKAFAECNKSLEKFFDGNYQHFQNY